MMRAIEKYEKYFLWGMLTTAFFTSLIYACSFRIVPSVDARAYDNIALSIADGGGYPDSAINRPGPGYAYFLAGIYRVFGHHYIFVWLFQSLCIVLAAGLTYRITHLITGSYWHPSIGLIAAGMIGFSLDLITVSSMLLTESLSVALMALFAWLMLEYTTRSRMFFLIASACALGLLILTRGNAIFLVVPLGIWLIYKKDFRALVLGAVVLSLTLVPWTIHNYKAFGIIKPFNGSAGLLYVGNRPGATGELDLNYKLPEGYDFSSLDQLDSDNALGKAGKEYILSHPFTFVRLTMLKASIYASFARPFAFWPHLQGLARTMTIIGSVFYGAIVFLGGTLGYVMLEKKLKGNKDARDRLILFMGLALTLPLSVIWLVVETRYRFVMYPFLAVGVGVAIYTLCTRQLKLREIFKPLIIISILVIGNTVFDIVRNIARIKGKL